MMLPRAVPMLAENRTVVQQMFYLPRVLRPLFAIWFLWKNLEYWYYTIGARILSLVIPDSQ